MSRIRGLDAWLTTDPFARDDDGPCDAQSPDGRFACTLGYDHDGNAHEHKVPKVIYSYILDCPYCQNGRRPPLVIDGYEMCYHDQFEPGTWVNSEEFAASALIIIAVWPVRPDDFDDDGNPTPRGKKDVHAN